MTTAAHCAILTQQVCGKRTFLPANSGAQSVHFILPHVLSEQRVTDMSIGQQRTCQLPESTDMLEGAAGESFL